MFSFLGVQVHAGSLFSTAWYPPISHHIPFLCYTRFCLFRAEQNPAPLSSSRQVQWITQHLI